MRVNNAYEAAMRMAELNKEIMEINDRMKGVKENSIQYNVLNEEVDRRYSEFLLIKHALQEVKIPVLV